MNRGFPGGSVVKTLPANAGDPGGKSLIPGSGRSPRVGNGNPLQYSCLENSMDRSLAGYSPWGCKESDRLFAYSIKNEYQKLTKGTLKPLS